MFTSMLSTFPIVLVLAWTVNGYECPGQLPKACNCGKIGENLVQIGCTYGTASVKITKDDSENQWDRYTTIYCSEEGNEEEVLADKQLSEIFPALELGAENSVKIDLVCPLGEITVKNYLDRLGLTEVHYLKLFGQPTSKITKEVFVDATTIDDLNLYHNGIESLPDGVFDHLVNLSIVDLSENIFKSLPENMFKHNKMLRKFLFFRNGQNLVLPNGLLSELPALQIAMFPGSRILEVPADLFNASESLKSISLAMNALKVIPETLFYGLVRLEDLHLDENEINVLPENLFKTNVELKILNFSSNKLTSLPANLFQNNQKLQKIDFGVNEIQTIPVNLFTSLADLEELDLRMNKIQRLTGDMLPAHVTSLSLHNNRLEVIDSSFLKRFDRELYTHFTFNENPIKCECNENLEQLNAVSAKVKGWAFYRCGNVDEWIVNVVEKCKESSQS